MIWSVTVLLTIIVVYSQSDCNNINATFPINMDDTVCHGLYNVPAGTTYDKCAQECCVQDGCEVYQFNPSTKQCWMGGLAYCTYTHGWQSRARSEPPTSHIWPLPYQYSFSPNTQIYIDPNNFNFILDKTTSDIMNEAIIRYKKLTFPHEADGENINNLTPITSLTITIDDYSENTLQYGMDESYTLNINTTNKNQAILSSPSVWGALRGLESFSQIVIFNYTATYYTTWYCSIDDKPRFSHRGIMIDTSRHYLTVQSIMDFLDSLSYAKFNVLHWHITDSESFPFESKLFPNLWQGSYTKYERYTQKDVAAIIKYAKYRGIRVIPEFDIPGHGESWCIGYENICPSKSCNTPLNVASNDTWNLLNGFIGEEVVQLFDDDYIHLGGDEVNTKCWNSTQSIVDWMNMMNFTANDALRYFDERAQQIVYSKNKQVIVWVSVFNSFNTTLNKEYVTVQVYKSPSALQQVVERGFHGILSNAFGSYPWYLDYLNVNWEKMYLNEPLVNIKNITQQQLVMGGEGCMWGETVDASDIQQTVWPRAAAIAERLWSKREINSTSAALPRIAYFRCLLNERGIASAIINNPDARQPPPQPGSCYSLYERRRR